MTTDIPRGALPGTGSLTALGTGGEGTVYDLPADAVPQQVQEAAAGRRVVYKQFRTPDSPAEAEHHRAVVGFLGKLGPEQREWLLDRAAWPLAVVADAGTVCGILMPRIPDRFFRDFPLSGGRTRRDEASFQMLLNDDRYLQKMNLRMSEKQIYSILLEVCELLRVLQGGGIVVGDISSPNLMFSVPTGSSGTAAVYLIDCAAVSTPVSVNPDSVETPDWDVPSGEKQQTREADRYKFGLLVLRLLSGHQSTRDPGRLPAGVPFSIHDLVVTTLTEAPVARPSFDAWREVLQQVAASADSTVPAARPTTASVTVPTSVVAPVAKRSKAAEPVASRKVVPAVVAPTTVAVSVTDNKEGNEKKSPDMPIVAKYIVRAFYIIGLVVIVLSIPVISIDACMKGDEGIGFIGALVISLILMAFGAGVMFVGFVLDGLMAAILGCKVSFEEW